MEAIFFLLVGVAVIILSKTCFALDVQPVTGAFPFSHNGFIVGSVQYAPIAFTFNLTSMEDQATSFASLCRSAATNFSQEYILDADQAEEMATAPLDRIEFVKGLFDPSGLHRVPRQAAAAASSAISMGLSIWALASVETLKGTVADINAGQIKLCHVVDGLVDRERDNLLLLHQINDSLTSLNDFDIKFGAGLRVFGYYGKARSYRRTIEEFTDGVTSLVGLRITDKLVHPHQAKAAFEAVALKAKKLELSPFYGAWQQIYLHEAAYYYQDGVLSAVFYVPLVPRGVETFDLWHHHHTPWFYNNSVLQFAPREDFLVTNHDNSAMATLPRAFLHGCRPLGADYLCQTPLVTSNKEDSCLGVLFKEDLAAAVEACPLDYLPQEPYFNSLNGTSVLVYLPDSELVFETCPSDLAASESMISGLNILTSDPHCFISSAGFEAVMGGSDHITQEVRISVFEEKLWKDYPFKRIIPTLRPTERFAYQRYKDELHEIENISADYTWIYAVATAVVVTLILCVIAFVYIRIKCRRFKNRFQSADIQLSDLKSSVAPASIRQAVNEYLEQQGWANSQAEGSSDDAPP